MYALVIDGTVQSVGGLPNAARRLDTGEWVLGLADAPDSLRVACGWYPVTDTARPADTADTTHDRTIDVVDGTPTVVWTARPKTTEEQAADTDRAAFQTREDNLAAAVATLRQWAQDAAGTTVTNGNNTAVTQTVVNRLGVFFDRFADLIENR